MNEEIKMLELELKMAKNMASTVGNDLEDAREAFEAIKMRHESALEYVNDVSERLLAAMRRESGE